MAKTIPVVQRGRSPTRPSLRKQHLIGLSVRHKLGGFKEQKCHLTVLEAKSLRSRCGQGRLLPRAPGENPFLPVAADILGLETCPSNLRLSHPPPFWVSRDLPPEPPLSSKDESLG